MKGTFGEFEDFEQRRRFARFFFWRKIEERALEVIETLADKPFDLYVKSNYGNSKYPAEYRIPPTNDYFENPVLAAKFQESLKNWQIKFGLGYEIDDFPQITFVEWFEREFPMYSVNKDKFPTHLDFLRGWRSWNIETPENFYEKLQTTFADWTTEKHFEYRSLENDWILKTACEFLHHWVLFPKDKEKLFLAQSDSFFYGNPTKPNNELPSWCWQIDSPENYAKSICEMARHEIEDSPILKLGSSQEKKDFLKTIYQSVLELCDAETETLKENYPNLKTSRNGRPKLGVHLNWLIDICILNQKAETRNEVIPIIAVRDQTEKGMETRTIEIAVRNLLQLLGLPINKNFRQNRGRPKK